MLRRFLVTLARRPIASVGRRNASAVASLESPQKDQIRSSDGSLALPGRFPQLTAEESERILQLINKSNAQDLAGYEISKTRVQKLRTWQKRNGALQNVQDILLVEGFGLKVVEKFYRSLLEEPKDVANKPKRARTAPFVTPPLDAAQQTSIRSCLSLRIGVSSVSWARLELPPEARNAPCLLTHWEHLDLTEKKLHLNDLVRWCARVDQMLPTADSYLLENPQMAQVSANPGSIEQQNINIQKAQTTAILSFALYARNKRRPPPNCPEESGGRTSAAVQNVFYLRRFLTARLFNHLVGTERVSSEETILNLMRTHFNMEEQEQQDFLREEEGSSDSLSPVDTEQSFRGNVQFTQCFREMFDKSERFHREYLGQALLLNLAFVRLVLLQDPESLALVTRTSKKDKESNEHDE